MWAGTVKIISVLTAALACFVTAAAASAGGTPRELFKNAFLAPAGHVANLTSGVTYKASEFPLPISVTIPEGAWGGAQWKYDSSFQHAKTTVAPYYGWVTFEHRDTGPAQGIITMMTPYGPTPTVAATVAGLRTRGRGATYEAVSPVKLGGYSGVQFDGKVSGKEHVFIPFSPKSNVAKWYRTPTTTGLEKARSLGSSPLACTARPSSCTWRMPSFRLLSSRPFSRRPTCSSKR
jgi:hypothetical protein